MQIAPHIVTIGDCVVPTVARCTPLRGTSIYDAFRRTIKAAIAYYGCESESTDALSSIDYSKVAYSSRRKQVDDAYLINEHKRYRPDIRRKYRVTLYLFL